MRIPIFQVDAFTKRRFAGNPAAVMLLERFLDDAVLQQMAAENNLAETAFLVLDAGDYFCVGLRRRLRFHFAAMLHWRVRQLSWSGCSQVVLKWYSTLSAVHSRSLERRLVTLWISLLGTLNRWRRQLGWPMYWVLFP